MKYVLYLYVYRLHNTFYLEVFDRVPSLVLSPLQARAIHLKHYNRREYREQQFATVTDIDSATDTEGVLGMDWMTDSSMSRSSSSTSFAQIGSLSVRTTDPTIYSGSTGSAIDVIDAVNAGGIAGGWMNGGNGRQQAHDHHFFAMQVQTDEQSEYGKHSPTGLQSSHRGILSYENAYANPFNVQVVVDLPAVSCSLYNVVSGCYKEVLHVYLNGIRCIVQRGGCELFSR